MLRRLAALSLAGCELSPWDGGDDPLGALAAAWSRGDCVAVVTSAPGAVASTDQRLRAATLWYGACLSELGRNGDAVTVLAPLAGFDAMCGVAGALGPCPGVAHEARPAALLWLGRAARRWDADTVAFAAWGALDAQFPRHLAAPSARLALAAALAPVDEAAAGAVLARLVADTPGSVLRDDADFARLRLPLDAGRPAAAILALEAVVDGPFADAAAYALGRAHEELGQLDVAEAAFRGFAERFPSSSRVDDAAYRLTRLVWARAEASLVPYDAVEAAVGAFVASHPASSLVPAARYWRGRALVARGALAASVADLTAASVAVNSAYADDATYYRARSRYRLADEGTPELLSTALADFDEVLARFPHSTRADDAAYFAARCEERLGGPGTEGRFEVAANYGGPWADDAALRWASLARARGDCDAVERAAARLGALPDADPGLVEAASAWAAACGP